MPTPPSLPYPLQEASKISIRESPRKTDFENPEDCQVWDSRLWMSTDVTEAFYKGGKGRTAQKRNATPSLVPFWNEVAITVFYESLYIFEEARAHPPSNSYSDWSPILSQLYTDRGRPERALLITKGKLPAYNWMADFRTYRFWREY